MASSPACLAALERQLAGRLVERGGDGQHDLLVLEPSRRVVLGELWRSRRRGCGAGSRPTPRRARPSAPRRAAPGEDVGLAVDAGVAEPALGAGDEVARHLRPLDPGELADDPVGVASFQGSRVAPGGSSCAPGR